MKVHLGCGEVYLVGGSLQAMREFLPKSDFVVDREWCDFFGTNATVSVDDFLRKQV